MQQWVEGPTPALPPVRHGPDLGTDPGSERVDALIRRPAAHGGLTATAAATLASDLRSRPSVAVDGDDATAWQTPVSNGGRLDQVTYPRRSPSTT